MQKCHFSRTDPFMILRTLFRYHPMKILTMPNITVARKFQTLQAVSSFIIGGNTLVIGKHLFDLHLSVIKVYQLLLAE